MEAMKRSAFKAYDIRGRVPDELNEQLAYRIGRAMVEVLQAKRIVVGCDVRLSSKPLMDAVCSGLVDSGCDVIDIGLCGTEMVYFATAHWQLDGGIMVTASHNPLDYNGFKLVRRDARPISGDTGLRRLEELAISGSFAEAAERGQRETKNVMPEYIEHLLSYVDTRKLKPLKILTNAGNGGAGAVIDALEPHLPFVFIKRHHQADGTFPNGIPNPLLVENREQTVREVKASGADFGIAWDGDFDRCFFVDERGRFIEGYYVVGLLADAALRRLPGAKIIHDPRLTWNTIEIVNAAGGQAVQSKTGHAFIKERMREEDAVYGGEMSAHHYFKEFFYCDSGMIPWLLVAALVCAAGKTLSELVDQQMEAFPVSGEINSQVQDCAAVLQMLEERYAQGALHIDKTDGLSVEMATWRFNVRGSNTEPLLRLNVESRADKKLLDEKTTELTDLIRAKQ